VPKTNEPCERTGTYVDDHGHVAQVTEGAPFPACSSGPTWWWHEDLPVAKQMRWEAERPPRPGGFEGRW
jgi:hypothetical protein